MAGWLDRTPDRQGPVRLAAALLLASCSAVQHPHAATGVDLDQRMMYGPTVADIEAMERVFAEELAADGVSFDPRAYLHVTWWPDGTIIAKRPVIVDGERKTFFVHNQTLDGSHVEVSSARGLMHELLHVAFFRAGVFNGDDNHEEPPGPWTAAMNEAIRRAELRYESEAKSP